MKPFFLIAFLMMLGMLLACTEGDDNTSAPVDATVMLDADADLRFNVGPCDGPPGKACDSRGCTLSRDGDNECSYVCLRNDREEFTVEGIERTWAVLQWCRVYDDLPCPQLDGLICDIEGPNQGCRLRDTGNCSYECELDGLGKFASTTVSAAYFMIDLCNLNIPPACPDLAGRECGDPWNCTIRSGDNDNFCEFRCAGIEFRTPIEARWLADQCSAQ